jgi:hypothetical protein
MIQLMSGMNSGLMVYWPTAEQVVVAAHQTPSKLPPLPGLGLAVTVQLPP